MSNFDETISLKSKSNKSAKIQNLQELIKAAAAKREEDVNPERKLLFRPKIHESWADEDAEDELEVRRRLLTDIAQKQLLSAEKTSFLSVDEEDEYNEEKNEIVETIARLKNRKIREEAYKKRIEAFEVKTKEEQLRREQEIFESEKHNPSKYGFFYGDGYYENNGYFGVKEELIEQLIEEGEEWNEKWTQKYPETFTEKFRRYFWPPKLRLKSTIFRTRGNYMDFPEVIADWPVPIDISYDRTKVEMLSASLPIFKPNEDGELLEIGLITDILKTAEIDAAQEAREAAEEEERRQKEIEEQEHEKLYYGDKKSKFNFLGQRGNKVAPKIEYGPEDYYYDDELGEFFQKKYGFEIEYHFDGNAGVWRKKRIPAKNEIIVSPYDYYWDQDLGSFFSRAEYQGIDTFVFDDHVHVYKIVKVVKQKMGKKSVNVILEPKQTEFRVIDFYYDEELGKWNLRKSAEEGIAREIVWDENGKRFARKSEGSWRGLTGFSPDDYYFDDVTRKFTPKPPRQGTKFKYFSDEGVWKKGDPPLKQQKAKVKTKSGDYFFDLLEGQFKLREVGKDSKYLMQKYAKIYFRNKEPKSGMYPEDYYWDTHRKLWLPRELRMELLQNARSGAPVKPNKGKGAGLAQDKDKFFWDIEEGEFFEKEANDTYYFDDIQRVWKSERLKNKIRRRRYAGDFYWDENKKNFFLKDPQADDKRYTYDDKEGVWKTSGTASKGGSPRPHDFVFDVKGQNWGAKGSISGHVTQNETNGIFYLKSSDIKTPDDFWFSDSEGRFYPKTSSDAAKYYFSPADRVWKKKGIVGPPATGFTPRQFFFDDYKFCFKLKVAGQDQDYYLDKSNGIFRHVTNLGKTRNGLAPSDYRWNSDLGVYALIKTYDKNRGNIIDEDLSWNPQRDYNKPWLDNLPTSTTASTASNASTTASKTTNVPKK